MELDIRLAANFRSNPKFKRLFRLLGAEGVLSLITLWGWARDQRPKGVLYDMDAIAIEEEAMWTGHNGELVRILHDIRFLDCPVCRDARRARLDDPPKHGDFAYPLEFHGWEEHQPFSFNHDIRSESGRRAALARWKKDTPPPDGPGGDNPVDKPPRKGKNSTGTPKRGHAGRTENHAGRIENECGSHENQCGTHRFSMPLPTYLPTKDQSRKDGPVDNSTRVPLSGATGVTELLVASVPPAPHFLEGLRVDPDVIHLGEVIERKRRGM